MTEAASAMPGPTVGRHQGHALLSAAEAIIKGCLETDTPVDLVVGRHRDPFTPVFDLATDEAVAKLLREHGTRIVEAPEIRRALRLARQDAAAGRRAIALVANTDLAHAMPALVTSRRAALPTSSALILLLEDAPMALPGVCPRRTAAALALPTIEPTDTGDLRDAVDAALRLGRVSGRPVAVIVHESILHAADTIEIRPNRVLDAVDIVAGLRPRRGRVTESGDALRVARRLELNQALNMPSPGERDPVGFIAIGPAAATMRHLVDALGLVGSVSVLEMRCLTPHDASLIGRFLLRFENVVVLEPRPGVQEAVVHAVAEDLRHQGKRPGLIAGRVLPASDTAGVDVTLEVDDVVHPSLLARRITDRLHRIRPRLQVARHLLPEAEADAVDLRPREAAVGSRAAMVSLREIIDDVAARLGAPDDPDELTIRLVIDEAPPQDADGRVVMVETWAHERFVAEGASAVVHAARTVQPWIFVVLEQHGRIASDLERLARSVIPGDRVEHARVDSTNLADRTALRAALFDAARADRLTILTVRDGPPARYDVATIEQWFGEIDRLGFRPRQVLTWPADLACRVRLPVSDETVSPRVEAEDVPLGTEWTIERPRGRGRRRASVMLQPMREQVIVTRERPPAWRHRSEFTERLPQVVPTHARQSEWRAHLAGYRGTSPGPAARLLCGAGRRMGYAVKCVWSSTPIGPGRRAWAQVLFTRPRRDEANSPRSAAIPYGEADVLLGLDPIETIRAVGPDPRLRVAQEARTAAVVNVGDLDGTGDALSPQDPELLQAALRPTTRTESRLVADVADACRIWFHTTRVTDVVLLGMAFQRGLVPITPDALEAAVPAVEALGFGRLLDAFRFGRRLVEHPHLLERTGAARVDDLARLQRSMVLLIRREPWGGRGRAERFAALLRRSLDGMPGLTETDAGRQARREFVNALYRCLRWGGMDYAQRYADLITTLYRVDRGDRGRALTRNAILPLAEVMLIRDGIYVASMASSSARRRQLRRRLNVKRARGDRIERRYLVRAEATIFGRRLRLDARTSDWAILGLAAGRRIMPRALRGTRPQRELRSAVMRLITDSNHLAPADYDAWARSMQDLHELALRSEFRGMRASTLQAVLTPPSDAPDESTAADADTDTE